MKWVFLSQIIALGIAKKNSKDFIQDLIDLTGDINLVMEVSDVINSFEADLVHLATTKICETHCLSWAILLSMNFFDSHTEQNIPSAFDLYVNLYLTLRFDFECGEIIFLWQYIRIWIRINLCCIDMRLVWCEEYSYNLGADRRNANKFVTKFLTVCGDNNIWIMDHNLWWYQNCRSAPAVLME